MTDDDTTGDDDWDRRTFLKRGVATSAAAFGLGPLVDQPDERPVPRIDAIVPRIDLLANQYLRRLVVFTEQLDESPSDEFTAECFPPDGPSRLVARQAIVADWEGIVRLTPERIQEATDRVVQTKAYLPASADVSISAPYVIVGGDRCLGQFLRVEAHKLPEAVRGDVGSLVDR